MHTQPDPLTPESSTWQRVSAKYAVADLITNLVTGLVVVAVLLAIFWGQAWSWWRILIVAGVGAIMIVSALLSFRRVKAIGYQLRDDDFIFRRGIMFERIIAVPYGRLQLVDVNRGPLLRMLGLATLKFVTASQSTGVQLPGLRAQDAETLRDELIALAETRRSGL